MKASRTASTLPWLPSVRLVLGLFGLFLLSSFVCPATTVIAPDFPSMVAQAEQIFTAKVLGVRSDWTFRGGRRCIVTSVNFGVEQMHKGGLVEQVRLEFLGGTVGDETMEVKGVPRFKAGERVILFAEKNGRQFCPLVGIHHGKLLLERDAASGSEILIRHTGRPLISVGEFGSEDGGHGIVAAGKARSGPPMSVERFLSAIRSELLKGRMR